MTSRRMLSIGTALAFVVMALGPLPASGATRSLAVSNASVTEATSTTKTMTFTVRLSSDAARTVKVDYKTVSGTAKAGTDYTSKSGTLRFDPGDTKETIKVAVKGDPTDEYTEKFSVKLSDPLRASIADGTGVGTISDNDAPPFVSLPDATIVEGTDGKVPIVLNRPSAKPVSVFFQTMDSDTTFSGVDFTYVDGTFTIPAGSVTTSVTIQTPADDLDEPNQYFPVSIRNPVNAVLSRDDAEVTIADDDAPPSVSIGDVTIAEGNSGEQNAVFTITASAPSAQDITGQFGTVIGTASYEDSDYGSAVGGWTIPAGQTTTTINVPITGDTTVEPDETFEVTLSGVLDATVSDGTAVCTITNDD